MKGLILLIIISIPLTAFAQQNKIRQLQKELQQASGVDFLAKAIDLSDAYYKAQQYERAATIASRAYHEANRLDHKDYMAISLNKEARAIARNKRLTLTVRKTALEKFGESLELLHTHQIDNKAIENDNLDHLQRAASFLGEIAVTKGVDDILEKSLDSALKRMENNSLVAADPAVAQPPNPPRPPKPWERRLQRQQELLEKIMKANQKRIEQELKAQQQRAYATTRGNQKHVDIEQLLARENAEIERTIVEKREKIDALDSDAAKEELLLAQYQSKYDSLTHLRTLDSINLAQQELEIQKQEAILSRQKARRSFYVLAIGSILLLAAFLLIGFLQQKRSNKLLTQKNQEIQKEQERSEQLLLNILPAEVAAELKENGHAQAHKYDSVSVLFTDFQDFSKIVENLPPEMLVSELDYCFKAFDNIISKYKLEKIKTIGDAYMCAGGLPSPTREHANRTIRAALDMQSFLNQWKVEKMAKGEHHFEARIGIHTGPIVAGVVGVKKFAYDIWGNTVNIASRMESGSEAGKINISGNTYKLVRDSFRCRYRGKMNTKNTGEIEMYFVEGVKEA